jgi:putative transposase
MRVWADRTIGRRVYGARKVWREGIGVARRTVERLMGELVVARRGGQRGSGRGRRGRLVRLTCWNGTSPRSRRAADITYVDTASGLVLPRSSLICVSPRIVGWQVADTLRAELALDVLEMAIWSSRDMIGGQLIHHSDSGLQYTSIPGYAERLGDIGAVRSVGSKGDSYGHRP